MKATSILLCIAVIVGTYEVRQASSSDAAARLVLKLLKNRANCETPLKTALACLHRKYRTFDGTCNNLCNITLGSAEQPLERLLPPDYEGPAGSQAPRSLGVDFKPLTNPRKVSVEALENNDTANINGTIVDFTHLTMTWGQFLDHDVTLTELPELDCGINNAPCRPIPGCVNIKIPNGLELLFNESVQCIPLARSLRNPAGNQINIITAYVDGSQVYGSSDELAKQLRSPKGHGRLDTVPLRNIGGLPRLPDANEEAFCRSPNPEEKPCFIAGDARVNENQALMAMHTLWVREHNRIATNLKLLRPYADDETLFQEARKIVIAELQHITYNEWLPVLFPSKELRKQFGVLLKPKGKFFTGYDPEVNVQCTNVFSTSALRMGHSLIRAVFDLRSADGTFSRFRGSDRSLPRDIRFAEPVDFFIPTRFFNKNEQSVFTRILFGLIFFVAQTPDRIFVNAVRERLVIEGNIFGDLMAINIQRARDHGLPGYAHYREVLGLGAVNSFDDLSGTFSSEQIARFKAVYKNVKDVDVFPGSIAEGPFPGSVLGSVNTHIILKQMGKFRSGDRFWYERDDHLTAFTLKQLDEIRKVTMARVMCDNLDGATRIQRWVFKTIKSRRSVVDCADLDYVDLKEFSQGAGVEPMEETGGEESAAA